MIHDNKTNERTIGTIGTIAKLNDNLRRNWQDPSYGLVLLTTGIQALCNSESLIKCLMQQISDFNNFNESNDPYGEHDMGMVEFWEQKICWKIDYYNPAMAEHSENPADPFVTRRVLTIMLAEEY